MTRTHTEDLALAQRLVARDPEAARELLQKWSAEMFGFAHRLLRDRSAAEDAFQEAMLGALQNMDRYDGRVALRSWVYAILRNKIADAMRKRGRDFTVSSEDPEERLFDARGHWRESYEFQPFDENAELLEIVEGCMETLPLNQREALALRAVEGLSSAEAAQAMGISNTNLRQVLHRARQNVRRCVAARTGQEVD